MSEGLEPCPCCGGEPAMTTTDPNGDPAVQCRGCGLEMRNFDAEEAVQDWNRRAAVARPRDEWHDDDGPVLWWWLPVRSPPYVGTPLDHDWPDLQPTHWTSLVLPVEPTP